MTRTDLLALTPDTLAALANRGLVKRAAKDLDAGAGPDLDVTGDHTVHGCFPDGTETRLPPGATLQDARCSCEAHGVCRHRIGLVLAYQRTATAADTPRPFTDWSPGSIDDTALAEAFGRPALTAARRTRDRGYQAVLHRPTPADPVPTVELPACTVRFPVPHRPGFAVTDAAEPLRGATVVLAVWAFRAADSEGSDRVTVGGKEATPDNGDSAHRTAMDLVDELLVEGVPQAGPVLDGTLRRAGAALTAAGRHWPAAALEGVRHQLAEHAVRGARHDRESHALLLAELHARHRAAPTDPAAVLGTAETARTALRRVRLVALGCHVDGSARDRTADVFFAHPDAGIVLVLHKRWELPDGQAPTGHDLGSRRILGTNLRTLAAANVVSEATSRTAGRAVEISRGRIATTSVTPVGTAWDDLPPGLLVTDLAAQFPAPGTLPPRLVRPRVEAESMRVLAVAEAGPVRYDPAAQRLEAVLHDPAGNEALLSTAHNPHCPGTLDALADALASGTVDRISGSLRHDRGRVLLAPLAVRTSHGVLVPDLAPGDGDTALPVAPHPPDDPLTTALEQALAALAEAAHHGLRNLTATDHDTLESAAALLHRTGFHTTADQVSAVTTTLRTHGPAPAASHWHTAVIRLATTLELHRTGPYTPP
ncbi:hypothetical protein [Streptomyces sp. NPDC057363]|uniref:hypothetical protein n=1 Tax=Streptomyces sp. NPDC057363 TaxID=3346107 RepID=UPI00362C0C3C